MPHYVLELKRPKGEYAVYSTIVDNLITEPMTAEAMRAWLEEREYTSYLKKGFDSLEDLVAKYGEDTGRSIHEHQERTSEWWYWNGEHGFAFAREADGYFCLPRSMWRNN